MKPIKYRTQILPSLALSSIALCAVAYAQSSSAKLEASVEIRRLNVSEYHRPYVAVWIQNKEREVAANLSVWYQMSDGPEGEGTKWLPDLRQWWRRSGRSLELPIDGVSGATRPAGKHSLKFSGDDERLAKLAPGEYELVVEAAREVGGRELIQLPFTWPPTKVSTATAAGQSELGEISLTLTP